MLKIDFSVFTVCNIAYLPKALVLADSLRKVHGRKLNVVLFDKKQNFSYPGENINVFWVEDLGVPKLRELAFMYDIIEFSTSLKPFIALKLLEKSEKVIFLDPDTAIFSELTPILQDLDLSPVVLTPHYTRPQPDTSRESDLAMMRFGSFNLGFFAVNDSEQAKSFLRWWNRRCIDFSFMESQFGLSTDQKWITIAPCLFDFLKISFNPGYNAAPWNTFERQISKDAEGRYLVNQAFPLVFFHFSNFYHDDPQYLNKRASSENGLSYPVLLEIGLNYSEALKKHASRVDRVDYAYDTMSDGCYITPTLRRAYASIRDELADGHDPFDASGPVGNFARRNHLMQTTGDKYKYPALKEINNHQGKLRIINTFLRLVLRVLGPRRFYDLSKLMVYLSLYRINRSLWRL